GPGRGAQGGIAVVLENYQKSTFWHQFQCTHFVSTQDSPFAARKAVSDTWRLAKFFWTIVSRKPCVVSVHTSRRAGFYRKLAYLIIAKLCRVPVVLHVHPSAFSD